MKKIRASAEIYLVLIEKSVYYKTPNDEYSLGIITIEHYKTLPPISNRKHFCPLPFFSIHYHPLSEIIGLFSRYLHKTSRVIHF